MIGALGLIAILEAGLLFLFINQDPIHLPGSYFDHNEKIELFHAHGPWSLVDDNLAWPKKSSTIHCHKSQKLCVEATAIIAEKILMPVNVVYLDIVRWDADMITARGNETDCLRLEHSYDLKKKLAFGTSKSICRGDGEEKRLLLKNGAKP
jgi:hypothetical protein